MTLVVDAGVVVAALVDDGPEGRWAESVLTSGPLAAPHQMPVEVTNILRRATLAGSLSSEIATLAHADLLRLRAELFSYEPMAHRVWELRSTVTSYDAWYVALAEELDAPLATVDRRLSRASGPRCHFQVPPG
ncbi:MAG: type II toxin-antitoxin system VapC family toxin [Pseudonocardia sp.]